MEDPLPVPCRSVAVPRMSPSWCRSSSGPGSRSRSARPWSAPPRARWPGGSPATPRCSKTSPGPGASSPRWRGRGSSSPPPRRSPARRAPTRARSSTSSAPWAPRSASASARATSSTTGSTARGASRPASRSRDAATTAASARGFRLLSRMEKKLAGLVRELERLELTQVGKSGLATRIPRDAFMASESSACFVAYLVARMNLRSEFTVSGQQRAFDEIAAMLLTRCRRDPATSWLCIAHVHPTEEVLGHLDEVDKLALFAAWFDLLRRIAARLSETWSRSRFDLRTMIVRRGTTRRPGTPPPAPGTRRATTSSRSSTRWGWRTSSTRCGSARRCG